MTDRASSSYVFATPYVEAKDWRETLRNHARTMRTTFLRNPILCDLILIRSALSPRAAKLGVVAVEKAIEDLVEAGLTPEDAFDTYSAVRCTFADRLCCSASTTRTGPPMTGLVHSKRRWSSIPRRRRCWPSDPRGPPIGASDETNFEYGLDCILDHSAV